MPPSTKKARRFGNELEGVDWSNFATQSVKLQSRLKKSELTRGAGVTAAEKISDIRNNFSHHSSVTATLTHDPMRLTVKASSSKLRQATRFSPSSSENLTMEITDDNNEPEINGGKRGRRGSKKSYALAESDSEEEEDNEMPDLGDEEDDEDDEEDDDKDGDDYASDQFNVDADGESNYDDIQPSQKAARLEIVGKKPAPPKTVDKGTNSGISGSQRLRQIQQDLSDDDEELSELESILGEDEESMQIADEEDSEGDDPETRVETEEVDKDLDVDEMPGAESRASTPELNKLTRRQRARFDESNGGYLMALPDEVQVKKHLTAEEHAMRRAEMARRRKNLSEKRNEEEKLETINKLLKKQAPKTNARRGELNAAAAGDGTPDDAGAPRPDPLFVRWVSTKHGNRIGVPEEWVNGPLKVLFKDQTHHDGKVDKEP
ncbi:hypothetical protein K3495_g2894 [Podosphaera aphanis]|nr:hypothetical protein K3495_g2894 [Podosphaera aphanis]